MPRTPEQGGLNVDIVAAREQLDPSVVRAADISGSKKALELLADAASGEGGLDLSRRPYSVFSFGQQQIIVDAGTLLTVFRGLNSEGQEVYEIDPVAQPTPYSPRAGFVAPPESAWVYNTDGSWTDYVQKCDFFGNNCVNAWKRLGFYTIMAAWNQGSYQYFRMYGRQQSATLTGIDFPWARTWLEFDNNGGWGGSPAEFEFPDPDHDIPGQANATLTIGFSTNVSVELGKAPTTVTGSIDNSYTGSITVATEYWHPVNRAEIASGGVQYCRYDGARNQTKKVATRVGIRQNVNAQLGGWYILRGMQNNSSSCPGPS